MFFTLALPHLLAMAFGFAAASIDDPTFPGYVPRGVVLDFADLTDDSDVQMVVRFEVIGHPPLDWPVTTGRPSSGKEVRDRLDGVFRHSGWTVRRLGQTRLEFRTAVEEVAGKSVQLQVTGITVTSRRTPSAQLPKVVWPVKKPV